MVEPSFDNLTDSKLLKDEANNDNILQHYPYLLAMQSAFLQTEINFKPEEGGVIKIETKDKDFSTSISLRKATLGDFNASSKESYSYDPNDYFVVENVVLKTDENNKVDLMDELKKKGITYFTLGKNPNNQAFLDRFEENKDDADPHLIDDVRKLLYASYAYGMVGKEKGGIVAALPIDASTLFIFAHELGHLQPESKVRQGKKDEVYKQYKKPEEVINAEAAEIDYMEERGASAYALNYSRTIYKILGIPVNTTLRQRLRAIYTAGLYSKRYERTGILQRTNKPVMNPDAQSKDYKGHQIYTHLAEQIETLQEEAA